jgi:hypothetical protein
MAGRGKSYLVLEPLFLFLGNIEGVHKVNEMIVLGVVVDDSPTELGGQDPPSFHGSSTNVKRVCYVTVQSCICGLSAHGNGLLNC